MKTKLLITTLIIVLNTQLNARMVDPTKPPKILAPLITVETEVLKLRSIKIDSVFGQHWANINGVEVYLNGMYADAKVIFIDANTVHLKGPKGNEIILKLWEKNIKYNKDIEIGDIIYPDIKKSVRTTKGYWNAKD